MESLAILQEKTSNKVGNCTLEVNSQKAFFHSTVEL